MAANQVFVIDPADEVPHFLEVDAQRLGMNIQLIAGSGLGALATTFEAHPAIVVINVTTPAARPLDLVERVRDALPETAIVAVVPSGSAELCSSALRRGANMAIDMASLRKSAGDLLANARKVRSRLLGQLRAVPPFGQIVAVFGAKGGVGTTTLAANLAVAARSLTHGKTALLDADPPFGDAGFLLGADIQRVGHLSAAGRSNGEIECRGVRVVELAGIDLPLDEMRTALELLRTSHDTLIVDAGTDPDRIVTASDYAAERLMVVTSDLAGARGAALTLRLLRQHAGPGLNVRMVWNRRTPTASQRDFLSRETGASPDWEIDDDRRILWAAQAGEPYVLGHRNSEPARTIFDIAKVTLGLASPPPDDHKPNHRWLPAFGRHAMGRL